MAELRVGCGFDVHAFAENRPLLLGGVTVPHTRGLAGHSDADVLTHAIVDAMLGAAGLGDIGDWFPSSDPRYLGVNSLVLLDRVTAELRRLGWRLINVDTTVLAQEPKLSEQRAAICTNLAQHLDLEVSRVSVKATTTDHLGSVGRAEGIAAQAVVLIEGPPSSEGASRS